MTRYREINGYRLVGDFSDETIRHFASLDMPNQGDEAEVADLARRAKLFMKKHKKEAVRVLRELSQPTPL